MRFVWSLLAGLFLGTKATSASPASASCRALIPKIICEVAAPVHESDRYKDGRLCLKTTDSSYQAKIQAAFDGFPAFLRKRFCRLNRIYIERDFFGSAWSGAVDESSPMRFLIGLRKEDIDANLSIGEYLTWFEQQSFGGSSNFSISSKLPLVHVTGKPQSSTAFTLLHEFGHTFDYEFEHNRPRSDSGFYRSWTHLSWEDVAVISSASDFDQRKNICLNGCHGQYMDASKASSFYQNLLFHGFLSQLAATNAREDFADSFAFYVAQKYMGLKFEIEANGTHFSVSDAMGKQAFKDKFQYLTDRF